MTSNTIGGQEQWMLTEGLNVNMVEDIDQLSAIITYGTTHHKILRQTSRMYTGTGQTRRYQDAPDKLEQLPLNGGCHA